MGCYSNQLELVNRVSVKTLSLSALLTYATLLHPPRPPPPSETRGPGASRAGDAGRCRAAHEVTTFQG